MHQKYIEGNRYLRNTMGIITISLFLALSYCIPATEKESCESYGCSDTGLNILVVSCPFYLGLQSFDCKNYSPRYKSESQCITELPGDKDNALLFCAIGIQSIINLEKKSDAPFSGGVCIFNC